MYNTQFIQFLMKQLECTFKADIQNSIIQIHPIKGKINHKSNIKALNITVPSRLNFFTTLRIITYKLAIEKTRGENLI